MKAQYLLISLLLAAASCARETFERPDAPLSNDLAATLVRENTADTKVQFMDNPGIRMESRWAAGDRIGVFSAASANIRYEISKDNIAYGGRTAIFRTDGTIPAGTLHAYGPYQEGATGNAEAIQVHFPATQHYSLSQNVPAPDPDAFLLAGTGSREDGLSFYCVNALLKIGYTPDENQVVTQVVFEDLNGKAVNGPMTVSWEDGLPKATLGEGGSPRITLDYAEGVLLTGETPSFFWLNVPARTYTKGFRISFILKDGMQIDKTVGSVYGKTLYRGIVHPVGDVPPAPKATGDISYKLKDNVVQIGQDKIDLFKDASLTSVYMESPARPGTYASLQFLKATVHKDAGLHPGDYVIIQEASDLLPAGFIGMVTEFISVGDEARITIRSCEDIAEPFEYFHLGSPVYAADGSVIEGGGLELDLASSLERIVTPDGQDLPFDVEGDTLTLYEPPTKAMTTSSYTSPRLKLKTWSEKDSPGEMTAGVQIKLSTRFSMSADEDGETEYLHFNVNPKVLLTFNVKFSGSYDFDALSGSIDFGKFYFSPVTVGPLLLRPAVEIGAYCSASASAELNVSYKYIANWGNYGFAYQRGHGFSVRSSVAQPEKEDGFSLPEASVAGSIGFSVGLYATPELSLYGLINAKLKTKIGLNFSSGYEAKVDNDGFSRGLYFQIAPEFSLQPSVTTIGGVWTKTWDEWQPLDFEPLWQKYLWPEARINRFYVVAEYGEEGTYPIMKNGEKISWQLKPIKGYNKVHYDFDLRKETAFPTSIGFAIYRSKTFTHIAPNSIYWDYIDAGMEDYVSLSLGALAAPEFRQSIEIDTYPGPDEGEDSKHYEGDFDYEFENGWYYCIVPDAFITGRSYSNILKCEYGDTGTHGLNRHNFICHWPYLSNGEPFPKKE